MESSFRFDLTLDKQSFSFLKSAFSLCKSSPMRQVIITQQNQGKCLEYISVESVLRLASLFPNRSCLLGRTHWDWSHLISNWFAISFHHLSVSELLAWPSAVHYQPSGCSCFRIFNQENQLLPLLRNWKLTGERIGFYFKVGKSGGQLSNPRSLVWTTIGNVTGTLSTAFLPWNSSAKQKLDSVSQGSRCVCQHQNDKWTNT